jgi:thiol-disulfide isomerase/thioredoxin
MRLLRSGLTCLTLSAIISSGGCSTQTGPAMSSTPTTSNPTAAKPTANAAQVESGTAKESNAAEAKTAESPPSPPKQDIAEVDAPKEPVQSDPTDTKAAAALNLQELDWDQLQKLVASHKGKVIVVDIWSTSCEPCIREFPHLVALQKRHVKDVVCISFDCDFDGRKTRPVAFYRERVLQFLMSQNAEELIHGMSTIAADELFQKIDVDSIPAVFVYDQSGKLAGRFDNRTPVSETEEGISYEKQIDPLVAKLVKAAQN